MELIPFMEYSNAIKFYKKIRDRFNENSEYDDFLLF